ncbi:hypothetical protein [Phormidium nigroviride]
MSEQVVSSENQAPAIADSEPRIGAEFVELLQEIQETPREHWANLLQIVRLFREAVTVETKESNISRAVQDNIDKFDPVQQHKSLSKLLQSWIDEGDEQEQTETAEYLRKVLDEDRLSNRPLFP